jgi:hypothetical protein
VTREFFWSDLQELAPEMQCAVVTAIILGTEGAVDNRQILQGSWKDVLGRCFPERSFTQPAALEFAGTMSEYGFRQTVNRNQTKVVVPAERKELFDAAVELLNPAPAESEAPDLMTVLRGDARTATAKHDKRARLARSREQLLDELTLDELLALEKVWTKLWELGSGNAREVVRIIEAVLDLHRRKTEREST